MVRKSLLSAVVAASIALAAAIPAKALVLTLDSVPYMPGVGFSTYTENGFIITQQSAAPYSGLSGGTLLADRTKTGIYGTGSFSQFYPEPPKSFTLRRVDNLGFTIGGYSLVSYSTDLNIPNASTSVSISPTYAYESNTTVVSARFDFYIPYRRGFLLDSITVGDEVLATPGPVAGAGIPALLALAGGLFWRRRYGSAA